MMKHLPLQFKETLNRISPLTDTDWALLEQYTEQIYCPRRGYLLHINEVEDYIYFVTEGLIRTYLIQDDRELCIDFGFENNLVCSFISYHTRRPSDLALQALLPTTLVRLHYSQCEKFFAESPSGNRLGRLLMQRLYHRKLQKEVRMLTHSAEENYEYLIEQYPNYVQNIPVKDLASYLGIHPDSLSRIRRRLTVMG